MMYVCLIMGQEESGIQCHAYSTFQVFSLTAMMDVLNLFMQVAAKTAQLYNGDKSLRKAKFRKYLKDSCSSNLYKLLSFK